MPLDCQRLTVARFVRAVKALPVMEYSDTFRLQTHCHSAPLSAPLFRGTVMILYALVLTQSSWIPPKLGVSFPQPWPNMSCHVIRWKRASAVWGTGCETAVPRHIRYIRFCPRYLEDFPDRRKAFNCLPAHHEKWWHAFRASQQRHPKASDLSP